MSESNGTRAVITVHGLDQVGIIARVCSFLADKNVSILDISQSIVKEFFNMMMIVDLSGCSEPFADLAEGFEALGDDIGVVARIQSEGIFNATQRV